MADLLNLEEIAALTGLDIPESEETKDSSNTESVASDNTLPDSNSKTGFDMSNAGDKSTGSESSASVSGTLEGSI